MNAPYQSRVLKRLSGFRRQLKWLKVQRRLLQLLAGGTALFAGLLLVEHFGDHSPGSRELLQMLVGVCFCAGLGLAGWIFVYSFVLQSSKPGYEELARKLGWGSKSIRDRLLNALQILDSGRTNKEGFDPELIQASLDTIAPDLEGHRDRDSLPIAERNKTLRHSFVLMGILVVALLAGGEHSRRAWNRIQQPAGDFRPPAPFVLHISVSRDTLILGETTTINVSPEGHSLPQGLELFLQDESGTQVRELQIHRGLAQLKDFSPARRIQLWAKAGDIYSDSVSVLVKIPPMLEALSVRSRPPYYTKLPARNLPEGVTDLVCPVGSLIEIKARLTKGVTSGQLTLSGKAGQQEINLLDSLGFEGDALAMRFRFRARQDMTWQLDFSDDEGLSLAGSLPHQIRVIPDQPPRLRVIDPLGGESRLDRDLVQPLVAVAEDDYGISRMRLVYHISSALFARGDSPVDPSQLKSPPDGWLQSELPLRQLDPTRSSLETLWDLTGDDLLPDDRVQFYLEVFDNDGWNGRKSVRSMLYTLKVPGMEELYAEVEEDQEDLMDAAEEVLEETRENQQKMRELAQELKRDPEMKWEQQQKLKQLAKRHEELMDQAEQTAQKLEQMQEKMELNALVSEEMKEKFKRLTDLLKEAIDPELREKMRKAAERAVQEPNKSGDKKQKQAMRDMEEMLKSMERQMEQFLAVLEEMQMQQKLEEFGRRLAEMADRQNQLEQRMTSEQGPRLAREEQVLEKDYQSLKEEFEEFREDFSDNSALPREELAAVAETMEQEQPESQMAELSEKMEAGETGEESQEMSQELEMDLEKLAAMLNSASQQASKNSKEEMAREIDRICQELLVVSLSQEDVNGESKNLARQSARLRDLAEQSLENRMGISACADAVEILGQRSFHIPKNVLGLLFQSTQSLDEMLVAFEERKLGALRASGPRILGAVNRSILLLKDSKEKMQQSSSAGGFEEMMEKLAQASAQQQSLNSQCNKLMCSKPGQGEKPMSISFSEAASQQADIRKQMESLSEQLGSGKGSKGKAQSESESSKEGEGQGQGEGEGKSGKQKGEGDNDGPGRSPDGRRMLGDLGQAAADMEEVEKDLQNQLITERTRQLQERILTRLLEAQQSVRRQDLSPKRKSRTAEQLRALSPIEQLPKQQQQLLQKNLLRAMREGYSPENEELIRDYFRALENSEVDTVP